MHLILSTSAYDNTVVNETDELDLFDLCIFQLLVLVIFVFVFAFLFVLVHLPAFEACCICTTTFPTHMDSKLCFVICDCIFILICIYVKALRLYFCICYFLLRSLGLELSVSEWKLCLRRTISKLLNTSPHDQLTQGWWSRWWRSFTRWSF